MANYATTNAEIAPSLNRNLAACRGAAVCAATATVPLIAPQTMFDDRLTRLDVRLAKRIAITQRMRLQANFNIYNVSGRPRLDFTRGRDRQLGSA